MLNPMEEMKLIADWQKREETKMEKIFKTINQPTQEVAYEGPSFSEALKILEEKDVNISILSKSIWEWTVIRVPKWDDDNELHNDYLAAEKAIENSIAKRNDEEL